ncbi:MAG: hypothetical protein AWU57_528 [Marinobacter sp. T13-3]|nr:MAG: hypothetical protein AWU57_528 [Marinobacter sp. T13-3]
MKQHTTPAVETPTTKGFKPGRVGMRVAQVYACVIATFLVPSVANAAGISDWFVNMGKEFATIIPIIVVILGAVGVVMAGFGIISAVMAKKNQRPLEYQHWLIVGGVLCVLLVPFVLALGQSISGKDASGNVDAFMQGNESGASWN